jgi:hypothetical protein
VKVVAERGYTQAMVREIAKVAGVSTRVFTGNPRQRGVFLLSQALSAEVVQWAGGIRMLEPRASQYRHGEHGSRLAKFALSPE